MADKNKDKNKAGRDFDAKTPPPVPVARAAAPQEVDFAKAVDEVIATAWENAELPYIKPQKVDPDLDAFVRKVTGYIPDSPKG